MSERLTYQDLDRDELLALLHRGVLLCSQADLLWAKWEVTSARALKAAQDHSATFTAEMNAIRAYRDKPNPKTLGAWEAAVAAEKRASRRADRLRRSADQLYERHEKAMGARS